MRCSHTPTQRVSSHVDLAAAVRSDEAMSSEHCCDREACIKAAVFRVQGHSGRPAVFVPLPGRPPRKPAPQQQETLL